jgi:hypothetical protein
MICRIEDAYYSIEYARVELNATIELLSVHMPPAALDPINFKYMQAKISFGTGYTVCRFYALV